MKQKKYFAHRGLYDNESDASGELFEGISESD
jgi:hypothetical protein